MTCKAIREGDEMACSCGLRWGIDDDDRPQCPAEDKAVKLDMTVGSHNTLAADDEVVKGTHSLLNSKPDTGRSDSKKSRAAEAVKAMRSCIVQPKKGRLRHVK